MTSIGQALVQITIGVNPHLPISNQLFCYYSLAHCLAHRLSIARYCLRSFHHYIPVSLINFHMCCTLVIPSYIVILISPIFVVLKWYFRDQKSEQDSLLYCISEIIVHLYQPHIL
jgi:hypothetical protein